MSPQSPSNSSISTDTDQAGNAGKNPAAAFGANEWLVDEIYQQYLQDPNSVDRAWWDFFADYKPGAAAAQSASGAATTDSASAPQAAPAPQAQAAAPAQPKAAPQPAAPAKPAAQPA
ncbi:2-oxoglutarate dehydrogenase E1 subunit family protein, partial [Streptomyces rochei]